MDEVQALNNAYDLKIASDYKAALDYLIMLARNELAYANADMQFAVGPRLLKSAVADVDIMWHRYTNRSR